MAETGAWGRRERYVSKGVANAFPIFVDRALGAEIWDPEGRRYIDFVGGIAVQNVGHGHPEVVAAIQRQAERCVHAAFQVQPYEAYVALAERLAGIVPIPGEKKSVFLSTGAEAVENAVKIARAHTGRRGVIAFHGAFHGRTLLTLAMTGKLTPYKAGFGPFPGDVAHAPFPMEYRGYTTERCLEALDDLFHTELMPEEVAAIVIEPVLGEGGYYPAPAPFLQALRDLCDRHGIVFVSDEVQAGFARTGRWFAIEHAGVIPDLVTMAKSLAGGMPLSGVVGKAEIMDAPHPGGLGGTYGGNPIACAAALAAIDVIEREDLCGRARAIGARIRDWATARLAEVSLVGDLRGPGAMVGLELVSDRTAKTPAPEAIAKVRSFAEAHGLLLLGCGYHANVIRIMVPLTVSDAILDEGLDILARALEHAEVTA